MMELLAVESRFNCTVGRRTIWLDCERGQPSGCVFSSRFCVTVPTNKTNVSSHAQTGAWVSAYLCVDVSKSSVIKATIIHDEIERKKKWKIVKRNKTADCTSLFFSYMETMYASSSEF